ncbi:formyltransferase family protein [[Clostridium] colinum]|uniref:formyltransferase family protein n=1 Tax=[Clostridium] colinum TaxID=36835 RepID=UPI00202515EF|nr:formyltransferase family protein [[Clostridium] colinum]
MKEYFYNVIKAENEVFGNIFFTRENVRTLSIKSGDLNNINIENLKSALNSDIYVVFGSSFIKEPLVDFLVEKKAINIHMGISPYYRGSSCNFWAAYDKNPELIGATIHLLSTGLDSGDMLYHALPKAEKINPFLLGMKAVKVAQDSLVDRIYNKEIYSYLPVKQDKDKEIRYTRNINFNDEVAKEYLDNLPTEEEIFMKLSNRDERLFLNPYIK